MVSGEGTRGRRARHDRAAAAPAGALGLLVDVCRRGVSRRAPRRASAGRGGPRKEVIQPQVPLRLPCYDFTPVADPAVDGRLPLAGVGQPASGRAYSHGVTGGVYKARERIHRGVLIRDY